MSTKTHKGVKGRLKVTKSGKVLHRRTGKRHLLNKKSSRRKRRLRGWKSLAPSERKKLKRQYGFG
jgi:large subunit ribosomal protein L35